MKKQNETNNFLDQIRFDDSNIIVITKLIEHVTSVDDLLKTDSILPNRFLLTRHLVSYLRQHRNDSYALSTLFMFGENYNKCKNVQTKLCDNMCKNRKEATRLIFEEHI